MTIPRTHRERVTESLLRYWPPAPPEVPGAVENREVGVKGVAETIARETYPRELVEAARYILDHHPQLCDACERRLRAALAL